MKYLVMFLFLSSINSSVLAQTSANAETGTITNIKIRHLYCRVSGNQEQCFINFRRPEGASCGGADWTIMPQMLAIARANPNGRFNATCSLTGNTRMLTELWLVP